MQLISGNTMIRDGKLSELFWSCLSSLYESFSPFLLFPHFPCSLAFCVFSRPYGGKSCLWTALDLLCYHVLYFYVSYLEKTWNLLVLNPNSWERYMIGLAPVRYRLLEPSTIARRPSCPVWGFRVSFQKKKSDYTAILKM